MKLIYLLLGCLIASMLGAEVIANVEYQLPKSAQNWEVAKKSQDEKQSTIIYVPKGEQADKAIESFGVNVNKFASELRSPEAIKAGLAYGLPGMKVNFEVLEQKENSLIFEWSAEQEGQEKIHGFGKAFADQQGTVLLSYQTEDVSKVPEARSEWLPVLKEAHTQ